MISVSIWRKTLAAKDACEDGMALFDRIASMQPIDDKRRLKRIRVARWTPLHQLWLATAYPSFCSWLRGNGLIPWIDIPGADLSGANLSRADLSGAYLSGVNLYGANLSGANLSGANLSGASLYGASLSGANLSGANLSGAYRPDGDLPGGWERGPDGYLRRKP